MQLSLSRRFLVLLLAVGILSYTPAVSASDYDDEEQTVRKSKKKEEETKEAE